MPTLKLPISETTTNRLQLAGLTGTAVTLDTHEAEHVFMTLARLRLYAATKGLPPELQTLLETP